MEHGARSFLASSNAALVFPSDAASTKPHRHPPPQVQREHHKTPSQSDTTALKTMSNRAFREQASRLGSQAAVFWVQA